MSSVITCFKQLLRPGANNSQQHDKSSQGSSDNERGRAQVSGPVNQMAMFAEVMATPVTPAQSDRSHPTSIEISRSAPGMINATSPSVPEIVTTPVVEDPPRQMAEYNELGSPAAQNDGTITRSPSTSSLAPSPSRHNSSASSQRSRADSSDSAISSHWLREQLEEARVECLRGWIVPRSAQKQLITLRAVESDIRAQNPRMREAQVTKHAEAACGAISLYATLACIKKGTCIIDLLREGLTDEDLPLVRMPGGPNKFSLYRRNGKGLVETMEGWKRRSRENFERIQWWMIAPVFEGGRHYKLNEKIALPFVVDPKDAMDGGKKPEQGGYSEVHKVRIHPAHHNFWAKEQERFVAVKKLFSSKEKDFIKEKSILEQLGPKDHPHLIKLLATYEHDKKYHLMFPYADANLRTYWDMNPSIDFNRENVLWSLKQMSGIAHGLALVHFFKVTIPLDVPGSGGSVRLAKDVRLSVKAEEQWFGRHGDLKPENILWFAHDNSEPRGSLKIGDFGLGRFHGRDSRSGATVGIFSSPTYEPPECKLRLPVSRAYDMWSLGCIYLEFITWLLLGSSEIEGFSEFRGHTATPGGINDDNFFTLVNDTDGLGAVVRDRVVDWSNQLHAHKNCSQLIHELLELVMRGLLVVDQDYRIRSSFLKLRLAECVRKAESDEVYMIKPVPREMLRTNSAPLTSAGSSRKSKAKEVTFSVEEMPLDLVGRTKGTPSLWPSTRSTSGTWPLEKRSEGIFRQPLRLTAIG